MKKNLWSKRLASLLLAGVFLSLLSFSALAAEAPAIDGDLSEWSAIPATAAANSDGWGAVKEFKVAKDEAGNLYFAITGWGNQYMSYEWSQAVSIDGAVCQPGGLHWDGGSWAQKNDNGNNEGYIYLEMMIPAAKVGSASSVAVSGTTVPMESVPVFAASTPAPESDPEPAPVYNGIVIDGTYSDWDAVRKTPGVCPNGAHTDCLKNVAMIMDGDADMVYLYLEEGFEGSASTAGTHTNGQFAITTDLGKQLLIQPQLTSDGSAVLYGVESAQCAHVGRYWEVAIPKSALPEYRDSISFGYYLDEPMITGVTDGKGGNVGDFTGIVYDGQYADWLSYPHTDIQYATAGSQDHVVDAQGALWTDGEKLYGHVFTQMQAHLQEKGNCFLEGVTFQFNDDEHLRLYPNFVEVDGSGNINWYPDKTDLTPGSHEFYMATSTAWRSSANLSDLAPKDMMVGRMIVTVDQSGVIDQCEFYLELDKVAEYFNLNAGTYPADSPAAAGITASDFKIQQAQFGRLGQDWLTVSGASTAPWIGLGLCSAVALGGFVSSRKRKEKDPSEAKK